jgi:(2Fe-2S) ferredoxin
VLAALRALAPPGVLISSSGCLGQCASGPTVQVMPDQVWYCRVRPEDAADIVEQHILGDRPVSRLLHPRFHPDGVSADEAESGGDRQEIPTATD